MFYKRDFDVLEKAAELRFDVPKELRDEWKLAQAKRDRAREAQQSWHVATIDGLRWIAYERSKVEPMIRVVVERYGESVLSGRAGTIYAKMLVGRPRKRLYFESDAEVEAMHDALNVARKIVETVEV
jgi:hypothetical protein